VPVIRERMRISAAQELLALLQTPSRFYDGPVEGIVVRVCDEQGRAVRRGKIVRQDFLSSETMHWSKEITTPNTVRFDHDYRPYDE